MVRSRQAKVNAIAGGRLRKKFHDEATFAKSDVSRKIRLAVFTTPSSPPGPTINLALLELTQRPRVEDSGPRFTSVERMRVPHLHDCDLATISTGVAAQRR